MVTASEGGRIPLVFFKTRYGHLARFLEISISDSGYGQIFKKTNLALDIWLAGILGKDENFLLIICKDCNIWSLYKQILSGFQVIFLIM